MGLYSTVKQPSLSVQELAELDRLLDESYVGEMVHLTEFVVQVHENDKQLFDSLIECDFITATNQMVMSEAEVAAIEDKTGEVKQNKIMNKIKMILAKLKELIIKAAQSFITKVNDWVKADEKIYNTYKDVFKAECFDGFQGVADFAYPCPISGNELIAKFDDAAKKFASAVNRANSKDGVDAALTAFTDETETLSKKMDAEIGFGFKEKVAKFVPNPSQISEALGVIKNADKIIKGIKDHAKACVGQVKNLETYAKAINKSKEELSEVETYKGVKLSAMISNSAKSLSNLFSAYTRTATKQIAAYRKLVIICGRYAAKTDTSKTHKEKDSPLRDESIERDKRKSANEAMDWFLAESSDQFIMEHFAY